MSRWPGGPLFGDDPAPRSLDRLPTLGDARMHLQIDPDYKPAWQNPLSLEEIKALIPQLQEWRESITAYQRKILEVFHERYGTPTELDSYGHLVMTESQKEAILADIPIYDKGQPIDKGSFGTLAGIPFDVVPDKCGKPVAGTVPGWAGEDQISPCKCVRPHGHDPAWDHRCAHEMEEEFAKHERTVLYDGAIEVCDTCVNENGDPVAWEFVEYHKMYPEPEPKKDWLFDFETNFRIGGD